jgi:hypothetical protein
MVNVKKITKYFLTYYWVAVIFVGMYWEGKQRIFHFRSNYIQRFNRTQPRQNPMKLIAFNKMKISISFVFHLELHLHCHMTNFPKTTDGWKIKVPNHQIYYFKHKLAEQNKQVLSSQITFIL